MIRSVAVYTTGARGRKPNVPWSNGRERTQCLLVDTESTLDRRQNRNHGLFQKTVDRKVETG